jgi:hypothetical protein
MAERAAHLVEQVFPPVAVRQWVLSLPHRVRYLLAWDHALCRAVVAVYLRAVLGFLRRRAGQAGVKAGQGGAVAIIQRFGAALKLNVHGHALVLDGVFAEGGDGSVTFHPLPPLGDDDVAAVLATVRHRIVSLLQRRGLLDGLEGFDLHANVLAPAGDRERLERLCRYALRPPIAQDRLRLTGDGQSLDGTYEEKFFLIHLPPRTSVARLVKLAHRCWAIEQHYQHVKTELGLDRFEVCFLVDA